MPASQRPRTISANSLAPPARSRASRRVEAELDALVVAIKRQEQDGALGERPSGPERMDALRSLMAERLIPVFTELVEKYSDVGFVMQMDASRFLDGGREIRFEFAIGEYRTVLLGTVTSDAIAFQETRYSPHVDGELISGPMLRLHSLDVARFRDFVCERLLILGRSRLRRR